ncbi:serine hydrolase [Patescibacteria group bacterium]|nr:serine hydrolase [Patescibacteria group bacterium]
MISKNAGALIVGAVIGTAGLLLTLPEPSTYAMTRSPQCAEALQSPELRARAAYVEDLTTGAVLYKLNDETQLPIASLTKLLTVLTALPLVPQSVPIDARALAEDGEDGLRAGDQWVAVDLARFVLIESSNDGAAALAFAAEQNGNGKGAFIAAMNRRAQALELPQTFVLNETGLDMSKSMAGAYGSARDMAHLIAAAVRLAPDVTQRSTTRVWDVTSASGRVYAARNTTPLPSQLSGAIASKTGYTDLAGGNLALVVEVLPGRPVALAVLGSTRAGRETDAQALIEYATLELKRRAACTL